MWTTWSGKASKQPGLLGLLVSVSQGPPPGPGDTQWPAGRHPVRAPTACPHPPRPQASDSAGLWGASWQG